MRNPKKQKLNITEYDESYFIEFNIWDDDSDVAEELNIPLKDYIAILKRHGAQREPTRSHWFKSMENAERALEELESIQVMNKLMEE